MVDKWKADFKVMDIDGKGRITISNLKRILNLELGMNIDDQVLLDMIEGADFDGDDVVNEADFIKLMKKIHKNKK